MSASISNALIDFFEKFGKPEYAKILRNDMLAFGGLVITAVVIYFASTDPNAASKNFYLYVLFGILPVVAGAFIVSSMFSEPITTGKLYFLVASLFVLIFAVYMFYRIMNPAAVTWASYFFLFLGALGVIVGLAIIYRIFVRSVLSARGWLGLLFKVIFLIPCLLIDFMEYTFAELKVAPKIIFALFIVEILIILAWIYIPKIPNADPANSVVLLNTPVFMSKKQTIGNASQFKLDVKDVNNPGKEDDILRTHYGISMWVFVNQHSNEYAAYAKETDVFRYGMVNTERGHPRLSYYNNTSDANRSDKFLLYITDDAESAVPLNIPAQSWNQVVINYGEDSTVEIFVNGDLVKSAKLTTDHLPKYSALDVVEVGSGDDTVTGGGLHGAICNVVYHKNPLTAFEIAGNYNLNRYRNPPIHH